MKINKKYLVDTTLFLDSVDAAKITVSASFCEETGMTLDFPSKARAEVHRIMDSFCGRKCQGKAEGYHKLTPQLFLEVGADIFESEVEMLVHTMPDCPATVIDVKLETPFVSTMKAAIYKYITLGEEIVESNAEKSLEKTT